MNMLSFLWPRYRDADWQAPSSTRDIDLDCLEPALFPAEEIDLAVKRPPLNLSIDQNAIAFDDRYQHLRSNHHRDDPAELLLALVKALRMKQDDPRQAGQASALNVAWHLRKLDAEGRIDPQQDAKALIAILQRYQSLSEQ